MHWQPVIVAFIISLPAWAQTRVAVSAFKDKTGSSRCRVSWFSRTDLGDGFRDQIVTSLKRAGYKVFERENLKQIHADEHELVNMDRGTALKKNGFKTAHYSITGAVTSFEMCADGLGGDVDVGGMIGLKGSGLKVGGSRTNALAVLDLRVVDNETGEVVESVRAEGKSSSTDLKLKGNLKGAGFNSAGFKNTPIGEASRAAIADAVKQIEDAIPRNRKDKLADSVGESATLSGGTSTHVGTPSATASAQASVTTTSQYCLFEGHKYGRVTVARMTLWGDETSKVYASCKLLEKSKQGRFSVLDLNDGSKAFVGGANMITITAAGPGLEPGARVILRADNPKLAIDCGIIDATSKEYVVVCGKKELTVSQSSVWIAKP